MQCQEENRISAAVVPSPPHTEAILLFFHHPFHSPHLTLKETVETDFPTVGVKSDGGEASDRIGNYCKFAINFDYIWHKTYFHVPELVEVQRIVREGGEKNVEMP